MAASSMRNIVEHVATFHIYRKELGGLLGGRHYTDENYDDCVALLDGLTRGNFFAWDLLIEGRSAELYELSPIHRPTEGTKNQIPVGRKAIKELAEVVPSVRGHYNQLCDFVHPNAGGHLLSFRYGNLGAKIGGVGPKTSGHQLIARALVFTLQLMRPLIEDLDMLRIFKVDHNLYPPPAPLH